MARVHSGQSGQSSGSSTLVPPQNERWDQSSSSKRDAKVHNNASNESLPVNTKNGRSRNFSHVSQIPFTDEPGRAQNYIVSLNASF